MYIFVTPNGNLEERFLWIVYNSFTILARWLVECSDDTHQIRRTFRNRMCRTILR